MRIRLVYTESFRLAAIYMAVFVLTIVALGVSVVTVTDRAMREQIIQYSQADIAAINEGNVKEGLHEATEVAVQLMAAIGHSDFLLLQKDGHVLAGNLPAMPERLGSIEIPSPAIAGHTILGVGVRLAPGLYAFSGTDLAFVAAIRGRIIELLLWLFAAALLVALVSGILVSRSFVARLDAIAATCRAIMAGNIRDRIPLRESQNELDRLAGVINAMLDRIAALMDNLRQVSSDIAHDMRTPLTHLRQKLERARSESRAPEDLSAALDAAISSSDEILSLFAALLRISQIEGGARRAGFKSVDLAELLKKLREVYGAVAEDANHRLAVDDALPAPVQGDPELLFQLLANLVENGIVHTPAGTLIQVSLHREDARAVLTVRDDGPGVPEPVRDKIFRRFYRLDASRSTPGHGLGLALVAAVVELHGGAMNVAASGQDGRGLTVTLILPLSP